MVDLMSTLKRLKCPNMLLELMSLIYRFIFALMETAHSIHISQTSRLGHSTLPLSFKSSGVLISRLFILSMKKSEDIYVALESRGYDGEINVLDEKIQGKYSQYLKIIALNIFLVFITVLIKQGSWKI
jgi:cobalt/nickel transport system permease protein